METQHRRIQHLLNNVERHLEAHQYALTPEQERFHIEEAEKNFVEAKGLMAIIDATLKALEEKVI